MHTASESISTTAPPASHLGHEVAPKRIIRRWWILAATPLILGGLALGLWSAAAGWIERLMGREEISGAYHVVEPTTLQITLTEDGELKPRESAEITSP